MENNSISSFPTFSQLTNHLRLWKSLQEIYILKAVNRWSKSETLLPHIGIDKKQRMKVCCFLVHFTSFIIVIPGLTRNLHYKTLTPYILNKYNYFAVVMWRNI
jgi:hypothetical protein